MRSLVYILTLQVVLLSCSGTNKQEVKQSDEEKEIGSTDANNWEHYLGPEFENQEYLSNHQEHYWKSKIISSSLRGGIELISNQWEDPTYFLCANEEQFLSVKQISDSSFIALSITEDYQFFFYDVDYLFEEFSVRIQTKTKIENADYNINDRFNFIQKDSMIYYIINESEKLVYSYNLNSKIHEESLLDWSTINSKGKYNIYYSKDKSQSITIAETALILNKRDTLISQEYDGSWSFQDVTWCMSNDKVYFDNSGAVACIWEINLKKRTLDKVVPEHNASSPLVIYENGDSTTLLYCEEHCIKMIRNFKVK